MSRKSWVITDITEYAVEGWTRFKGMTVGFQNLSYAVGQLEMAPTTERPHGHYVMVFKKTCRMTAVKAMFDNVGIHCEAPKSLKGAIAYVQKPETRLEGPHIIGEIPKSAGSRTDLALYRDACLTKSLVSLIDEYPDYVARYPRFTATCMSLVKKDARPNVTVKVLWGPTGTGKTTYVHEHFEDIYTVSSFSPEWWDGYQDQKTVLFDDFNGEIPIGRLLRLLDRWPVRVPIKGGFVDLQAENIILTSNFYPHQWYPNHPQYPALERRIHDIEYTGDRSY